MTPYLPGTHILRLTCVLCGGTTEVERDNPTEYPSVWHDCPPGWTRHKDPRGHVVVCPAPRCAAVLADYLQARREYEEAAHAEGQRVYEPARAVMQVWYDAHPVPVPPWRGVP